MDDVSLVVERPVYRTCDGAPTYNALRYRRTMELLLPLAASIAVILLIAWRIRGSEREVGDLNDSEYRPPPIHGQGGPH